MRKYLFPSIFAVVLFLSLTVHAASKGKHSELSGDMKKISKAFKIVRRQISDASKNAETLEQVAIIKSETEASLKLKPSLAADLPEPDAEKMVADYQKQMQEMLDEVSKLEEALKANDNAAAKESVDKLQAGMKKGHKEFRKPDEKN